MENKLQELTQKLYNEGLEKGRAEAERLIADAKTEAAKLLAEARTQSEVLVKKAQEQAEDVRKNSMTEISLAGKQAVAQIRTEIATMIIAKTTAGGVKTAAMDSAFIKEMLLAVARNWNGANSSKVALQALLPEGERKQLDAAFEASTKELLAAGIEVGWSKEIKTGFKVGAKDGGYYISFSEADFDALLKEYLREKVAHLLYKA
ncbi:MAG: hypothetical protein RR330_03770 [Alistipes sp.]